MKKIIKLFLAIAVSFTVVSLTTQQNYVISAKISGDYSYEVATDDTVTILNYNGSEKNLTIPKELEGKVVKRIGYGAFAECKSIEELNIPDTITIINNYAFSQCSQIKTVNIADSVVSIGQYAFAGCNSLESVKIPSGISTLNYGTFFDCINLKNVTIPEGVKTIGGMVFANCKSLKSIDLPSTLSTIGSSGFADCTALESIKIPNGVTTLASSAFSGCLSINNIELPNSIIAIGQNAFQDCISLESIQLPESVTGIGYGAFTGCAALTNVNIPSKVTEIKNATFSGCSSLETIIIPDGIISLGDNVFSGCVSLNSLEIPDSVSSIGVAAFTNCSKLTSVKLPKNIKTISVNMFRYCDSLETVVIPNGVKKIEITAFSDCANLKSVVFPETVNSFDGKIFVNSPHVVAYVIDGSEAHTYMRRNDYNFELIQTGINLDKKNLHLNVNDTSTFTAIMSPFAIIENTQLTWASDNPSCASVNENGVVNAIAPGTANITATTSSGLVATSTVTVTDEQIAINAVSLNNDKIILATQSKQALRATINPSNTSEDKTLEWSSDDISVATVSATGIVTGRNPGTATITVTASNGMSAQCVVTVISDIKFVSLNLTAMEMEEGVKQSLRATINPSNTTNSKELKWKSSNTGVATVNQNGEVTAIAQGYATITVETVNGKKAECKITVSKKVTEIPITSVSLNKTDLSLEEGQSEVMVATINPSDTTESKELEWSSNNDAVATVDSQGKVTAVKEGEAKITVTTSNGKTASCIVTVMKKEIPITSVSLNKNELNLKAGKSEVLIATINPANTTNDKTLKWTSSNEAVATVNENGEVKAISQGTAMITVTTINDKTASCTVNVTQINTAELVALVNSAEALNEDSYTIDSYAILANQLTEAKAVLADEEVTQAEVNASVTGLQKAVDMLVLRADEELLNTLQTTINTCKGFENDYTAEEYATLKLAIENAEALMNKGYGNISKEDAEVAIKTLNEISSELSLNAAKDVLRINIAIASEILNGDLDGYDGDQINNLRIALANAQELIDTDCKDLTQIKAAINDLEKAINDLEEEVDKSYLEDLVYYASTISPNHFTTESWERLSDSLAQANSLILNPNVNQSVIDQVYEDLFSAISNLEVKVDKSALIMNIDMAQRIVDNISAYKANTVRGLADLLSEAKVLNENTNTSQADVNEMNITLMKAIMKARLKG